MENFNIIRQLNSPTKATLINERVVYRKDKIYVPEYRGEVRCAPYSDHFVFEVPSDIKGPAYLCSCGSMAVFVGSKAYGHLGSPEGMMLVCQQHTITNQHFTGGRRWI